MVLIITGISHYIQRISWNKGFDLEHALLSLAS